MPTASAVPFLMFHKVPEGKTLNNRWISFIDPEGDEFDLVAG